MQSMPAVLQPALTSARAAVVCMWSKRDPRSGPKLPLVRQRKGVGGLGMTGHPDNKGSRARSIIADMFSDHPLGAVAVEMFDDNELATILSQAQAKAQTGSSLGNPSSGPTGAEIEANHHPTAVYPASPIKRRRRGTSSEMEERARFLIAYAREHQPVTVRGLYYQAEVAGVPGIDKTENSYNKVQHQVLQLRRQGRISYTWISDATRWQRRPRTFDNWEDALEQTARTYRRSLWQDAGVDVEIWIEKDALAGVVDDVTWEYDVPLMVSRGYTSETFAFNAIEAHVGSDRPLMVYALYDFDRSGADAARSLDEKLTRFAGERGVEVHFNLLGLTLEQIQEWDLPTRPHKRSTTADQRWPHPYACELDAIPPDDLRALVRAAVERHLPAGELARLKNIEHLERETMLQFLGNGGVA